MIRKLTHKSWPRRLLLMSTVLGLLLIIGMFLLSAMSKRPDTLGIRNGQLAACPDSPNCVSSQAERPEQLIDPVSYRGEKAEVLEALKAAILRQNRTKIIKETDDYLYAESKSLIFRFVDDVEFYLDDATKMIHFRSASRIGHSDLGVNRTRIEQILKDFEAGRH